VAIVWQFPKRWPKVLAALLRHKWLLIKSSTLLPLGVACGMALLHTWCYRFVWAEADLAFSNVIESPPIFFAMGGLGFQMIYLDWKVLRRTASIERKTIEQTLDRGELAMSQSLDRFVRVASFGLLSPTRYVEREIEQALEQQCETVLEQTKGWLFRSTIRLLFGTVCWLSWGYLREDVAPLS